MNEQFGKTALVLGIILLMFFGYIAVSLQHRIIVLRNDLNFIEHYYHEVTINQGIDILKLEVEVNSLKVELDSLSGIKK